jgi:hypothetical protein
VPRLVPTHVAIIHVPKELVWMIGTIITTTGEMWAKKKILKMQSGLVSDVLVSIGIRDLRAIR